ncbi:MAG: hypothetical protein GC131_06460 [Alphaproteobacteria bacterium]|nr:hypothetical protein [Alphaproteobacteria bacterium]
MGLPAIVRSRDVVVHQRAQGPMAEFRITKRHVAAGLTGLGSSAATGGTAFAIHSLNAETTMAAFTETGAHLTGLNWSLVKDAVLYLAHNPIALGITATAGVVALVTVMMVKRAPITAKNIRITAGPPPLQIEGPRR